MAAGDRYLVCRSQRATRSAPCAFGVRWLYSPGMTSRVGPKGQVVIPKAIRDQVRLHPGDEVEVNLQDDRIIITAHRHADALGGKFAHSGMAARLLDDRAREPQ